MKKYQENIDLIEKYLEGTLDEEHKREVEEAKENDKAFAEQLNAYKFLMDGIRYSGRKELHQKMKEWDSELIDIPEKDTKVISIRNFKWYYIAASFILFMAAGIVIYTNLDSGYEGLVADYYKPYDYIPNIQRGEKADENPMTSICLFYERSDYQATIQAIEDLDQDRRTPDLDMLLASSYQAIGNYEEAIKLYRELAEGNSKFDRDSKWYLALCYLSINDPDQARSILEKLKDLNSYYGPKAQNLLEDLN